MIMILKISKCIKSKEKQGKEWKHHDTHLICASCNSIPFVTCLSTIICPLPIIHTAVHGILPPLKRKKHHSMLNEHKSGIIFILNNEKCTSIQVISLNARAIALKYDFHASLYRAFVPLVYMIYNFYVF